ncbi:MAG TPA: ribonuclease III domain-containing protein [Limnochordales bacterium]
MTGTGPAGPDRGPGAGVLPGGLSPALLAYVGDAVFELVVRTLVLQRRMAGGGGAPSLGELHRAVEPLVSAQGQARLLMELWPALTEAERDVVRRARNARSRRRPGPAGYLAYRRSTALEALAGYLYLQGQSRRLVELLGCAVGRRDGGAAGAEPHGPA